MMLIIEIGTENVVCCDATESLSVSDDTDSLAMRACRSTLIDRDCCALQNGRSVSHCRETASQML